MSETITPQLLKQLLQTNAISMQDYEKGLSLLAPPREWMKWIFRLLAILGVTFILAAIMFYCAYNFYNIPKMMKFASLSALITIFIAGFYALKSKPLLSELSLFAACFMIGVFWAVFGQIYQTGADSYLLFLAWGLLIIPFTFLSGFASLYALFVIVALLCFHFYNILNNTNIYQTAMLALPFALLGLSNHIPQLSRLKAQWMQYFLLIITLAMTIISYSHWLFGRNVSGIPTVLALGILIALVFLFRIQKIEISKFALIALAISINCLSLMAKVLSKSYDPIGALALGGLGSIIIFSITIFAIKSAINATKEGRTNV